MKVVEEHWMQRHPAQIDAWEAALGDFEEVSIFNHLVWYECLARNYSMGDCINISLLKDEVIAGTIPLMFSRQMSHGFPVRQLGFIENRNSLHNDIIVLPSAREEAFGELLSYIVGLKDRWDILVFKNIPKNSRNYQALVSALKTVKLTWQELPALDSPYLVPCGSWDEYLLSRSVKTRKTLRNIENKLVKAGRISVKISRTWDEYCEVRDAVYAVAQQSWTARIGDSLSSPENRLFFEDLSREAAARGWLWLWILYLNDKAIAFEYHIRAFGIEHAMRGSYLPEYGHLSPGAYLEMRILKHVFEEADRIRKYDFGGSFDQYKRKWTEDYTPHGDIVIFNGNTYSRILAFHEKHTVPALKKLRDRLLGVLK